MNWAKLMKSHLPQCCMGRRAWTKLFMFWGLTGFGRRPAQLRSPLTNNRGRRAVSSPTLLAEVGAGPWLTTPVEGNAAALPAGYITSGKRLAIVSTSLCSFFTLPVGIILGEIKKKSLSSTLFLSLECLSQCLPRLYLEAKTCFQTWSGFMCVCSCECYTLIADDWNIADFLEDPFTVATSITVFVVIIMLPLSGTCIIITGPHLVTANHHFFSLFTSAWVCKHTPYAEVYGTAFSNTIFECYTQVQTSLLWQSSQNKDRCLFLHQLFIHVLVQSGEVNKQESKTMRLEVRLNLLWIRLCQFRLWQ